MNSDADWQFAAMTHEVPEPGSRVVEVSDTLVALFRVGGRFYALDDICTHDGGTLADGVLADHAIACARHGAKFDIRDGRVLSMPATRSTRAHQVKVENDRVFVRLGVAPDAQHTAGVSAVGQTAAAAPVQTGGAAPAGVGKGAAGESPSAAAPQSDAPATISEDAIREALKAVVDPELFVNIVDLGLIYGVIVAPVTEGKQDIAVEMTMTSPACPAGPQLVQQSRDALGRLPGAGQVDVKVVLTPPWTPDRMTDEARDQLGIF